MARTQRSMSACPPARSSRFLSGQQRMKLYTPRMGEAGKWGKGDELPPLCPGSNLWG